MVWVVLHTMVIFGVDWKCKMVVTMGKILHKRLWENEKNYFRKILEKRLNLNSTRIVFGLSLFCVDQKS